MSEHRQGPPNDEAAEQAVLGAVMIDNRVLHELVDSGLRGDDFYRPAHETVWGHMLAMQSAGQPIDPLTVMAWVRDAGDLARIGGGKGKTGLQHNDRQQHTCAVTPQCILEAGNGSAVHRPSAGQTKKLQHISSGSWPLSTRGSPQLTKSTVSHTRAKA